jgi:hypothetical protein
MTTLHYLQLAKLKAVSPNENGVCPSDGLYLAPCYNSDGVLSYTCSPSGYKNVKAACDSCNPMGLKCPSDDKIKNLSRSCAGIGGNNCSNSDPVDPNPVDPNTECEGCSDSNICDTIILTKYWTAEEKTKVKSDLMISQYGVSTEAADCILSFISSRFNYDYYLNITCKKHQDLVVENIKSCIEKYKPSNLKISPFLIIGIIFLVICITGSLFYFYTRIKSKSSNTVATNSSTNSSANSNTVATNSSTPYILPSYTLHSSTLSSKCSETCTGTFTGTFKGTCV